MPTIYFLRGLPASGKTSWAIEKLAELNAIGHSATRVNKDEIRGMLGISDGSRESEVSRIELRMVIAAAHSSADIIIDDTNLYSGTELRYRKIAAQFNYRFEICSFLEVPLYECMRRDRMRDKPVGDAVILRLFEKYLASSRPDGASRRGRILMFRSARGGETDARGQSLPECPEGGQEERGINGGDPRSGEGPFMPRKPLDAL